MNNLPNNSKSACAIVQPKFRTPEQIGISIDQLRNAINYDAKTGEMRWSATDGLRSRHFGKKCGNPMRDGYLRMRLHGVFLLCHRAAWAHHFGEWPSGQIDHINRDKADNRIENLRIATTSQNTANQGLTSRNRHGLKGITPLKNGKWQAAIGIRGTIKYLGSFETKETAHARHTEAAREAFGEFACPGGQP
ncbi:MAG: HNH endonuclease [Pseudomonadota bacterium]